MEMLYDIRLEFGYRYERPATMGRHVLRLLPMNLPGQQLISGLVSLDPLPDDHRDSHDFFGNARSEVAFDRPVSEVSFRMGARVRRAQLAPGLDLSPPLALLGEEIAGIRSLGPSAPHHYTGASDRVRPWPEMTEFARTALAGGAGSGARSAAANQSGAATGSGTGSGAGAAALLRGAGPGGAPTASQPAVVRPAPKPAPGQLIRTTDGQPGAGLAHLSAFEALQLVGRALHRDMTFDPEATEVDTDAHEAFRLRRGVCQDFTHILIAALRGIGIPAGYVSGFLRTIPPPGKERLEGADAMHAWVQAWCGARMGWVQYDPTNDLMVAGDHVVVALGRDYSDVAPIRGQLRASGRQKASQKVDVIPL